MRTRLKTLIVSIVNKLGYQLVSKEKLLDAKNLYSHQLCFENFLQLYFSLIDTEDFFFLQIGANDGKTADPIYKFVVKYDLAGILVEPQPDVLKKLKRNYKDCNRLSFANVAISNKNETRSLYTIKDDYRKRYNSLAKYNATGKASFDIQHLNKKVKDHFKEQRFFKPQNLEKYIEEKKVNCLTLNSLMDKYEIDQVDFLQTDTEGFDNRILEMIDFNKMNPSIINYEHALMNSNTRLNCEQILFDNNYTLFCHAGDTCGFKLNAKK